MWNLIYSRSLQKITEKAKKTLTQKQDKEMTEKSNINNFCILWFFPLKLKSF